MRRTLIPVFISALSVCFALIAPMSIKAQSPQNTSEEEDSRIKEILRTKGLKEAVKVKGQYTSVELVHYYLVYDLESLTQDSSAIVIGVPTSNECQLTSSRDSITTVYKVSVKEAIKGAFLPDSTITVGLPGGRVNFDDGTFAEIRTPGFEKMVNGKEYVLFLTKGPNESQIYNLTGGSQGLFSIREDGQKIISHAPPNFTLSKYNNESRAWFSSQVRALAQKWPD